METICVCGQRIRFDYKSQTVPTPGHPTVISCGHIFHLKCLDPWIEGSIPDRLNLTGNCPHCQAKLSGLAIKLYPILSESVKEGNTGDDSADLAPALVNLAYDSQSTGESELINSSIGSENLTPAHLTALNAVHDGHGILRRLVLKTAMDAVNKTLSSEVSVPRSSKPSADFKNQENSVFHSRSGSDGERMANLVGSELVSHVQDVTGTSSTAVTTDAALNLETTAVVDSKENVSPPGVSVAPESPNSSLAKAALVQNRSDIAGNEISVLLYSENFDSTEVQGPLSTDEDRASPTAGEVFPSPKPSCECEGLDDDQAAAAVDTSQKRATSDPIEIHARPRTTDFYWDWDPSRSPEPNPDDDFKAGFVNAYLEMQELWRTKGTLTDSPDGPSHLAKFVISRAAAENRIDGLEHAAAWPIRDIEQTVLEMETGCTRRFSKLALPDQQ